VHLRFGSPLRFAAPAAPAEVRRAYEDAAAAIMAAIARLASDAPAAGALASKIPD
jgi:hypothetical protein